MEEYIKINRDTFLDLMILLKEMVFELSDVPHFRRESMYQMINNIEHNVIGE